MTRSIRTLAAAMLLAVAALPAIAAPTFQYTTIDVPGAIETQAYGIDDGGRVVGAYRDAGGRWHGFSAAGGTVTTIDHPGSLYTDAFGISPTGAIVGSASPLALPGGGDFVQGYVLAGGTTTSLVVPGATATGAFGINGAGTVVGGYIVDGPGGQRHHGAVWTGGTMTTLDVPGADDTNLTGINEAGQIVGGYAFESVGPSWGGFLWTAGTLTPVIPFGATRSGAFGLNDLGDIVGWYGEGDDLGGYLFSGGAYFAIEPPGALYAEAVDINNRGLVVGTYADANGIIHGFLATPVELAEPSSLGLAALALLGLLRRRGQRVLACGSALAALLAIAALPARAAPVLDYGYSAFASIDAGRAHWHVNLGRTGSETTTGPIDQAVADNAGGGGQAALTSAYASVGSMGGRVRASTAGAIPFSAQGFDDLSWYTDFLVTGTPGTKVSYLFGTALDGATAFGLSHPSGTYSGAVHSTTFVGGTLLADLDFNVLVNPGPFDVLAVRGFEFDVGTVVRLSSRLTVGAHADIESLVEADAFNTSRFFVDVLTPGGGYLAGGDVVFPNLPVAPLPVPAPATTMLIGAGLLAAARRRR